MNMSHITVHTKDLEKSISFYENALGMKFSNDMRPRKPIVFMADEKNPVKIELIENPEDAYRGSGISIGFHADNAEKMRKELLEKGYVLSDWSSPAPGVKFFYLEDPNGLKIQIL